MLRVVFPCLAGYCDVINQCHPAFTQLRQHCVCLHLKWSWCSFCQKGAPRTRIWAEYDQGSPSGDNPVVTKASVPPFSDCTWYDGLLDALLLWVFSKELRWTNFKLLCWQKRLPWHFWSITLHMKRNSLSAAFSVNVMMETSSRENCCKVLVFLLGQPDELLCYLEKKWHSCMWLSFVFLTVENQAYS